MGFLAFKLKGLAAFSGQLFGNEDKPYMWYVVYDK